MVYRLPITQIRRKKVQKEDEKLKHGKFQRCEYICLGEQSFNHLDAQKLKMEIHLKRYLFGSEYLAMVRLAKYDP